MPETSLDELESVSSSEERCLLVFDSIHHVMKAERFLKRGGLKIDLIPMPREISSDCGVAIELPLGLKKEALVSLEGHRLSIIACYVKKRGKYEKGDQE